MKSINFQKIEFLGSALSIEDTKPFLSKTHQKLPEVLLVGKSNVGKSSLINHFFRNRSLARVSKKPGKTQTLNFFLLDEQMLVIDLPGYGYAASGKEKQKIWNQAIDVYLDTSPRKQLFLFLVDSRHPPSKEDILFWEWARFHHKEVVLIFTKSDKVKANQQNKQLKEKQIFFPEIQIATIPYVWYSIQISEGKKHLEALIQKWINDDTLR